MKTIIIRSFGVLVQVLTAYRLISLLEIIEYGKYSVFIFEINILSVLLSFGAISFNFNFIIDNEHDKFKTISGQLLTLSIVTSVFTLIYFSLKYDNFDLALLLNTIILLKVIQNICYSGVIGEKGVLYYNIFLNSQLLIFYLTTYIPNINIQGLLIVWLLLSLFNTVILHKYTKSAIQNISWKHLSKTSLKVNINKSLYDFTNTLGNRYELIVLSFFKDLDYLIGILSVFMQIGDSLVNFLKTVAPKIQILALRKSSDLNKMYKVIFSLSFFLVLIIVISYKYWMQIIKQELVLEYYKFYFWAPIIFLSVVIWSLRFELQAIMFSVNKYNILNILILSLSILGVFLLPKNFILISILHVINLFLGIIMIRYFLKKASYEK